MLTRSRPHQKEARLEALFQKPAPWVVGVLNITPDAFSDGGCFLDADVALTHAQTLAANGADIIEIGAESTSPGSKPISVPHELTRLRDILPAACKNFFVSVDTYHAETAQFALKKGARMINDVSALRGDPEMADTLAKSDCLVTLMHAKDGPMPHVTDKDRSYQDVVQEIADFLKERIAAAESAGISRDRIVVDPGMGRFVSKDHEHSWELLKRFDELRNAGIQQPLMVGTSRKGFLEGSLGERDPLSQLTAVVAAHSGAAFVRTHNPKMFNEFWRAWVKMTGES